MRKKKGEILALQLCRFTGLVVKASASRAADPGFDFYFLRGDTVKYLVSAHPPSPPTLKHKFLRKVGGGRLLGILPFV